MRVGEGKSAGHRLFHYDTPCYGYVVQVYPIASDRRFYIDAFPFDNRGLVKKALVLTPPGFTAHLRKGMSVQIHYVNGNPQNPVCTLHSYNAEAPGDYADPLPEGYDQIDDVMMHSDVIKAYARFRSIASSAKSAAPDGSPGQFDLFMQSGAYLQFMEYTPSPASTTTTGANGRTKTTPNKPTRAKFSLIMPSTASLVIDEPQDGKADIKLTHPSGTVIEIDPDGNTTITATGSSQISATTDSGDIAVTSDSGDITVYAPSVALGDDTAAELAFKSDVQALVTTFNDHMHTGVQSGGSVSGLPQSPAMPPVGTSKTTAS